MHRLLLNLDEFSIDHDLVELRLHRGDELVQRIAKREVGAVSLKKRTPDLIESRAIEDQLPSENGDAVGHITCLASRNAWGWRWICHLRSRRRSEEHTSELQSQSNLVCRLL